jgi:hypothetical protein
MKPQLISVSEASRLVGKTRERVAIAARVLTPKPGPRGAKLYDAAELMNSIFYRENDRTVFELDRMMRERELSNDDDNADS